MVLLSLVLRKHTVIMIDGQSMQHPSHFNLAMIKEQKSLKLAVVGDGGVGKTCLLQKFMMDTIPDDYTPTVFENHSFQMVVEGETVTIHLWDTAGQEHMERLRKITYDETDIFLLCFSLGREASLRNVPNMWLPELKHHAPQSAVLLVGTKSDLRSAQPQPEEPALLFEQGARVAKKHSDCIVDYLECSALQGQGVEEVFSAALKFAFNRKFGPQTSSSGLKCVLL